MILRFANGALGTLSISDSASAPWSWEMTAGENKMYPKTDESCYWIAGSLDVPKLDLWHYGGQPHWGRPIQIERAIAPEADPLVLQLTHFCKVARREVAPLLDARGGMKTLEATLAVKQAAARGGIVNLRGAQTMLAVRVAYSDPEKSDERRLYLESHKQYLRETALQLVLSGPIFSHAGDQIGGMVLAEVHAVDELEAFSAADPSVIHSVYQNVAVYEWKATIDNRGNCIVPTV